MKKEYFYTGGVEKYGVCIADNWTASTYAESEAKAKSNLCYRFKAQFGLIPSTRITLTGTIKEV